MLRAIDTNEQGSESISYLAKKCVTELNAVSARKRGDVGGEVVGAPLAAEAKKFQESPVQVLLMDNSTRKVMAPDNVLMRDLSRMLAERLRLHSPDDFGLFHYIIEMETY